MKLIRIIIDKKYMGGLNISNQNKSFVAIFGSQRISCPTYRCYRLKEFSRHHIPSLNLFVDFHYNRGYEDSVDKCVCLMRGFGGFLRSNEASLPQKKARVFLLPAESLNEKPVKKDEIDLSRLNPVRGRYDPLHNLFLAARLPRKVPAWWKQEQAEKRGKSFLHEMTHFLTTDFSKYDGVILRVGVAIYHVAEGRRERVGLNEALTELVVARFYDSLGQKVARAYHYLVEGIDLLEEKIGFRPLFDALFVNDLSPVEGALSLKGFPEDAMGGIVSAAERDLSWYKEPDLAVSFTEELKAYILGCNL